MTFAYIQGPRSQRSIVTDKRYSINPETFELTISSVRFEDRGSYLGVIGVMDPEGEFFTYEQTRQYNITLDVYGKHFCVAVLNVTLSSVFCLL